MKKKGNVLLIKRFGLCLFCIFSCLFLSVFVSFGKTAGINFGSQNSALKISSGAKLNVTSTSLTLTSGTLVKDSAAQITGNGIGFLGSVFDSAGVEGVMTGVYSSNNSVNLVGSSLFRAQPGLILQNINVRGRLNRLEGQPLLSAPIVLQDSNTTLTLAVQSALSQNVQLNSGFVGLEDDLYFSDKKTFIGTGTVDVNGRGVYFNSGFDSQFTHTIDWKNSGDINLTNRTALSGVWNFDAGNSVLNGHGNILDLTNGGTLYVKSGATAEFTDVVIRGLGINKGWIDFEDTTGKIYMSNVILDLENRFRVSKGSFYVDGPSTFILKNNNLIFDQRGTLSVDGVTLWKDETIYASSPSAGNVVFGSLQNNRALIDAGIILNTPDSNLVVYNSNAILMNTLGIRYNSNAILSIEGLDLGALEGAVRANSRNIHYNSNAILKLEADDALKLIAIRNNSNAILKNTQNIQYNSEAIVKNTRDIRYNSSAILNITGLDLGALEGSVRANSRNIHYNSNAILKLEADDALKLIAIRNNSNAILKNTQNIQYNSEAIVKNTRDIRYNSSAILNITGLDLGALEGSVRANSRNIHYNSNAILKLEADDALKLIAIRNNSNAILKDTQNIQYNSEAIVKNTRDIRYNSSAILNVGSTPSFAALAGSVRANSRNIHYNSNAILKLEADDALKLIAIRNNSNAILKNTQNIQYNSEAIVKNTRDIRYNSSAILNVGSTPSFAALAGSVRANSRNIHYNSNAILKLEADDALKLIAIRNNSNAILKNTQNIQYNSEAIVKNTRDIRYNSNAIVKNTRDIRFNSNAISRLAPIVKANSNAILRNTRDIRYNSGAILRNTRNIRYNSNAILNVSVPNLAQLEGAVRANSRNIHYNSNAILTISALSSDLPKYNSNAILTLNREIGVVNPLTQGPLTTNVSIDHSYFINPFEKIEIAGDITIDGQGAVLFFADSDHPQFIVRPGYTVTLKNIQLERISELTFDLRWKLEKSGIPAKWYLYDSQINIEEEVEFGLSENITFSQGFLNIIRNVDNDPEVFTMCGIDGRKKFDLDPTDAYQNAVIKASNDGTLPDRLNPNNAPVLLRLNDGAMLMQEIDLWGIEHISKTITEFVGALVLGGDSSVNAGNTKLQLTSQQQNAGQKETCDLVFVVRDIDNQFRLLKDDLLFTGELLYADEGESALHFSSTFAKDIVNPVDDPQRRIPLVNFGTGFVNLTSLNGKAILIFDDPQIIINNSPNGFIAEENSFLGGHEIQVAGDYIWDLYDPATGKSPFAFDVERLIAPTLNNVPLISSLPVASPQLRSALENFRFVPRYKTAIDFKNQKEKEQDLNQAEKLELRASTDLQNMKTIEKIKKLLLELNPEYRGLVENVLGDELRNITPPAAGSKVIDYINNVADLNDAKGNINAQNATLNNFSILSTDPLNLTLRDGSILTCKSNEDITLKSGDILNIVGSDNELHVSRTFYMNGQLLFDEDSALTIVFDNSNAQVIFAENSEIDQELGVKFVVKGKGKIIFGNNCKVTLNGSGASFALQEWASLELMSNSRLDFEGVGKISVDQGAQINVAETGTIRIGISTSDKLSVSVASTGMINLSGKLLFAYGYTSLDVTQNGILMIQDHGLLGINIDQSGYPITAGHFDGFVLSPAGSFYLRPGGKLSIAANLKEYLPENKMVWKGDTTYFAGADITGKTGMVEYVSTYPARNVSGQIELFNGNFDTGETGLTAENLVRDLINRSYVLTQAIQFLDSANKRWLRLSNGSEIEMVVGDEIQREYENGVVEAKSLDGQIVLYKLNGTRVVMESYAVC